MSKKTEKAVGAIRHNTYNGKELTGFLVGLAGQNIIYNIISGGLQYFWQSIIFMPAMAISAIFFAARIWDAVNDPMIGSIVDKTR
ncbi:MAG: MFS transporter, partial [Ruminococcus sp.]|nr:MFS transporter [Ruminococcus sp.]